LTIAELEIIKRA